MAKDQYHRRAVALLDELLGEGRQLVTSDYVIAETVTRLRIQGRCRGAAQAWAALEEGDMVRVMEVERAHRKAARTLFENYDQHQFSLTDCASFVLMKELGIGEAATFDEDFRKVGFITLPQAE
jgi:predicted nucleic acid-binding protein